MEVRSTQWMRITRAHAVFFTLVFSPILFGGAFGHSDAAMMLYPYAALMDGRLFSGDILWNDLSGHGFPYFLTIGYTFHPVFLLLLALFSSVTAVNLCVTLYMIGAATLASGFLRREGFAFWVSLAGGATYAFSVWSWMFDISMVYFPLLFAGALVAIQSSERRPVIGLLSLSGILLLGILGLHVHYAVILLSGVLAFVVARTIDRIWRKHECAWRWALVGSISMIIALIGGLLRLLPLFAYGQLSSRSLPTAPMPWMGALKFSYILEHFLPDIPLPFLPGTGLSMSPYLGSAFIACILIACASHWKEKRVWGYLCGAFLFIAFALPLTGRLLQMLPFVSELGSVSRWSTLTQVSLIPIFCLGLTDVIEEKGGRVQRFAAGFLLCAGVCILLGSITTTLLPYLYETFTGTIGHSFDVRFAAIDTAFSPDQTLSAKEFAINFFASLLHGASRVYGLGNSKVWAGALALVTAGLVLHPKTVALWKKQKVYAVPVGCMLCLFFFFVPWSFRQRVHRSFYALPSASAKEITHGGMLLSDIAQETERLFWLSDELSPAQAHATKRDLIPPNMHLLWGIESVGIYEPMMPRRLLFYNTMIGAGPNSWPDFRPATMEERFDLLRRAGVMQVLTDRKLPEDTFTLVRTFAVSALEVPVHLYSVKGSRSYASFVTDVHFLPLDEEKSRLLIADSVLNPNVTFIECADCDGKKHFSGKGSINVHLQTATRSDLLVETEGPQWLLLLRNDLPGWETSIDGEKVHIGRADTLFMAIPVESGKHEVSVRFSVHALLRDSLANALKDTE